MKNLTEALMITVPKKEKDHKQENKKRPQEVVDKWKKTRTVTKLREFEKKENIDESSAVVKMFEKALEPLVKEFDNPKVFQGALEKYVHYTRLRQDVKDNEMGNVMDEMEYEMYNEGEYEKDDDVVGKKRRL